MSRATVPVSAVLDSYGILLEGDEQEYMLALEMPQVYAENSDYRPDKLRPVSKVGSS